MKTRAVLIAVLCAGCYVPAIYRGGVVDDGPVTPVHLPPGKMIVAPVTLPDDVDLGEFAPLAIDSMVAATLRSRGYDVVPPEVYGGLWDSLTTAAGGFFDPYSGRRREAEYDSAVTTLFTEMQRRFDPVSYVYPEVIVAEAEVNLGYAQWDGYREYFDLRLTNGTTVLALSLLVNVEGVSGREFFNGVAGLRIIERYSWLTDELELVSSIPSRLSPTIVERGVAQALRALGAPDSVRADSSGVL